jgi:drug/metabolite transporter (DMT)-like permease
MKSPNVRKIDATATLACLGALVCWSVGPIFIKLLTASVDSWTQNLLRYLVACFFWLPFMIFSRWRGRLDSGIWRKAALPAAANIVMQCLWAAAYYYIDPAFMYLLSKSAVIWIAGFSLIFFADERVLIRSKRFWLGMTMSVAGVIGITVFKRDFTAASTMTGIIITLLSAAAWAVYTILVRVSFRDTDSRNSFSIMSIYTAAGLGALALIFGNVQDSFSMGIVPWIYVVVSALMSIAFSHVLYYAAIRRIGATIPSLALLATPLLVLAISYVVFGEMLNAFQWISGIILLLGSGLAVWAQEHLG